MWSYLLVANVLTSGVRYKLPLSCLERLNSSNWKRINRLLGWNSRKEAIVSRLGGVNVFCRRWMPFCSPRLGRLSLWGWIEGWKARGRCNLRSVGDSMMLLALANVVAIKTLDWVRNCICWMRHGNKSLRVIARMCGCDCSGGSLPEMTHR